MRIHVRPLLLLILAVFTTTPASAQPPVKKVALLAGVNEYQKRNFKNLDYAERDVTELEKELKKLGFKTVLLTGSANGPLKATRKNIDEQLLKLLSDIGKQDIVMVALSGHGQQLKVPQPGGGEREDGFYCPYDSEKGNPASLFSLSYLTDEVLANKGGRNLVVIDACRDVPKDANRGGKGVQGKFVSLPENTAIFFSCSAEQQSWENDELKHGVFTYCLLEGLRGEAAKGNDIAWSNLIAHVDERMSSAEIKKYLATPQDPISAGSVPRTVLGSLSTSRPKPLPSTIPSVPSPSPSPPSPAVSPKSFTNDQGIAMVLIPAGEFEMGSTAADVAKAVRMVSGMKAEDAADEQPQHHVKISTAFYMGKYEVTVGQFRKFVTEESYKTDAETDGKGGYGFDESAGSFKQDPKYNWRNPGFPQTDEHPVVNVSWNDAQRFCSWLSRKEKKTYRLPSEAEWEYAARDGTKTLYPSGDDPESVAKIGNIADGTAKAKLNLKESIAAKDGYVFTAPVGRFTANTFGVHDMIGNAFEWCEDVYNEKAYSQRSATTKTTDPKVTSGSEYRVLRGGPWLSLARLARSAYRLRFTPDFRDFFSGFRVVSSSVRTP